MALYLKFPFAENYLSLHEEKGDETVSFVSFQGKSSVDFKGALRPVSVDELRGNPLYSDEIYTELHGFTEETEAMYHEKLTQIISFLKENNLPKLVFSRRKKIAFDRKLNLTHTFLELCNTYPNALVYLFIKDEKCWIGAFSELLGKFTPKNRLFETMALAGTLPLNEGWGRKEIEEQKPVTDFIFQILEKNATNVRKSETYDHPSGNIKHLRTDFKAQLSPQYLEQLIAELHPTPAVCGIPKELCMSAIERFEAHPRKLYAGYIRIEGNGQVHYFVNLRCAEIYRNAALLYVGGGITTDSDPAKEWQETELKAQAVFNNMIFV